MKSEKNLAELLGLPFRNNYHEELFLEMHLKRGVKIGESREYTSAFYLLSLLYDKKLDSFVDKAGIDFGSILDAPFSSGERAILKLAANLFNGANNQHDGEIFDVTSIFYNLSTDFANAALAAIEYRFRIYKR